MARRPTYEELVARVESLENALRASENERASVPVETGESRGGGKATEAELRRERDFSDAVLRNLPGSFYVFGMDGVLIRWNRRLEEVTGYSGEEIPRRNAIDFFPRRHQLRVAERVETVSSPPTATDGSR